MGRASRKKREEKLHRLSVSSTTSIVPSTTIEPRPLGPSLTKLFGMPVSEAAQRESNPPRPVPMTPAKPFRRCGGVNVHPPCGEKLKSVFRFFKEYDHAQAFLKGDIWISTLEVCRQYENKAQGDAGEGTYSYEFVGEMRFNGENDDPELLRAARLAGFQISGAGNFRIDNPRSFCRLPDALVLCTTEKYSPELLSEDFGRYCVEITDPASFFRHVSIALWERYDIGFSRLDRVSYIGREYNNFNFPEVHPGFLKPAQGYENQQEVRMLWTVRTAAALTPGIIRVPELAQHCRLVEPIPT